MAEQTAAVLAFYTRAWGNTAHVLLENFHALDAVTFIAQNKNQYSMRGTVKKMRLRSANRENLWFRNIVG